jgi:nitric oxide reductase subunit B
MAIYAIAIARRGGRSHPNRNALAWTIGCSVLSFVGAGFLGAAHTLPQVNMYTHGTLVTAMHGHMAFWGAYAMIVLALISYSLPMLTGRKLYDTKAAVLAFWASNIGMISMTLAFAVAGVTQVVLERRVGMEFLQVQEEVEMHFWGLILAASLFATGITAFVYNFIRHGKPVGVVTGAAARDDSDGEDLSLAEAAGAAE